MGERIFLTGRRIGKTAELKRLAKQHGVKLMSVREFELHCADSERRAQNRARAQRVVFDEFAELLGRRWPE